MTDLLEAASGDLGRIVAASRVYSFDEYSEYYAREMGRGLLKRLIAFEKVADQGVLAELKLRAYAIEKEFAIEGRRSANIDPALLGEESLFLSTFKYAAHRPYLGRGVYADLALLYRAGGFQPLVWTYPDYREQHIREWLVGVRRILLGLTGRR